MALSWDSLIQFTIGNPGQYLSVGSNLALIQNSSNHQILTTMLLQRPRGQLSTFTQQQQSISNNPQLEDLPFTIVDLLANPLRLNQSYYIKFYFTGHYLYVDLQTNFLSISKDNKTMFRILTNQIRGTQEDDLLRFGEPLQLTLSQMNSLSLGFNSVTINNRQNSNHQHNLNRRIMASTSDLYAEFIIRPSVYRRAYTDQLNAPSLLYQLQSQRYLSYQRYNTTEDSGNLKHKIDIVTDLSMGRSSANSIQSHQRYGKVITTKDMKFMANSFVLETIEYGNIQKQGLELLNFSTLNSISLPRVQIKVQNEQRKSLYLGFTQNSHHILSQIPCEFLITRYPEKDPSSNLILLQHAKSGGYLTFCNNIPSLTNEDRLGCIIKLFRIEKSLIKSYVPYFILTYPYSEDREGTPESTNSHLDSYRVTEDFVAELQIIGSLASGQGYVKEVIEDGLLRILNECLKKSVEVYLPFIERLLLVMLKINNEAVLYGLFEVPQLYNVFMESQNYYLLTRVQMKVQEVESPQTMLDKIGILLQSCPQESTGSYLAMRQACKLMTEHSLKSRIIQQKWNEMVSKAESKVTPKLLLLLDSIKLIKGRPYHDNLVSKLNIEQTLKDSSLSSNAKRQFMIKICQAIPASCLSFFSICISSEELQKEYQLSQQIPLLQSQTFQQYLGTILLSHYRVVYPAQKQLALDCASIQVRYGNFNHTQHGMFRLICDIIRNNIDNYTYELEEFPKFIGKVFGILYEALRKYIIILVKDSMTYDTHALTTEKQIEQCIQQVNKIADILRNEVKLEVVWNYLNKQSSILPKQKTEVVFNFLKFIYLAFYPQKAVKTIFNSLTVLEDPSKAYQKFMRTIFVGKHVYHPQEFMKDFFVYNKHMNITELASIRQLFISNGLLLPIVKNSNNMDLTFEFLSFFPNQELLEYISKSLCLRSNSQVNFLRKMLIVSQKVSNQTIFKVYQDYITKAPPSIYSVDLMHLGIDFVQRCPHILKVRFIKNFEFYVLINKKTQLQSNLLQRTQKKQSKQNRIDFIETFLDFMLLMRRIHLQEEEQKQKEQLEEIGNNMQDQWIDERVLLRLATQYQTISIGIKTKAIQLLYKLKLGTVDVQFMKETSSYIRNQIDIIRKQPKAEQIPKILPRYVNSLICLLRLRQETRHPKNKLSQNDLISLEGTNKLLCFQIVQLVDDVVQNYEDIIQNINWLENRFRLTISNTQLRERCHDTHHQQISMKLQRSNTNARNQEKMRRTVQENQCLGVISNVNVIALLPIMLSVTFFMTLKKQNYLEIAFLLRAIISTLLMDGESKVIITIKQIEMSSDIMLQCLKNRKYVHLMPLIEEVCILLLKKGGEIKVDYQLYLQNQIVENYITYLNYVHQTARRFLIWGNFKGESYHSVGIQEFEVDECPQYSYTKVLRLLTILSKSLNFSFKQIFSRKIRSNPSVMVRLIQTLNKCIQCRHVLTQSHLQLINSLLHGPMQQNIHLCLQQNYHHIINPLLIITSQWSAQIRKLVAEAQNILVAYKPINPKTVIQIQRNLVKAYKELTEKYAERGNKIDTIIKEYDELVISNQIVGFELILSMFYTLARLYDKQGDLTIKDVRTKDLRKKKLVKRYNKNFKMFYQIYKIIYEFFSWLFGKCCRFTIHKYKKALQEEGQSQTILTYNQQKSEQLIQAIEFLVRNTARIDIQIDSKIHTEYFLLMRQTSCYNTSIRKQLHRKVGIGKRDYRMKKFMEVSDFIILRLEIEKQIKKFIERYKPLELIIVNRQFWKSMNFMCASLLNLVFIQQGYMNQELEDAAVYGLRALSYIFCIFLFTIYIVQNLPLKIKIIQQNRKKQRVGFKKITGGLKDIFQVVNDKTLWFAFFYFVVISISFYELGFVAILMIDFFIRFKISKKVTDLLLRPLLSVIIVMLFMVEIIYLYTSFVYAVGAPQPCIGAASCIQVNFYQYMGIGKNLHQDPSTITIVTFPEVVEIYFRHINVFVNVSLIISLVLFEKKSKDSRDKIKKDAITAHCFICDAIRSDVDRKRNDNKGFYQHVQAQHNLWNYVFYLVYLKNRKSEDLTVIETMVMHQWRNNRISWLPNRDQ